MKTYLLSFFCLGFVLTQAQETAEEYGLVIFNHIIQNNSQIEDEFVDLIQYTSYIDRLEQLPEEERESIKLGASKSYTEVRQNYAIECANILELYQSNTKLGAQFTYLYSAFSSSKNFPDIGLITCYYRANLPGEEEPLEDAIVFECIKTTSGWRILDGFFDAPEIN